MTPLRLTFKWIPACQYFVVLTLKCYTHNKTWSLHTHNISTEIWTGAVYNQVISNFNGEQRWTCYVLRTHGFISLLWINPCATGKTIRKFHQKGVYTPLLNDNNYDQVKRQQNQDISLVESTDATSPLLPSFPGLHAPGEGQGKIVLDLFSVGLLTAGLLL